MADIYGKIIAVLPTRSGTSAKGTQWSSQTAVLETQEQHPKKVAFEVMNERISEFNLQVGEMLTVSFDIEAHDFNGRWYNNVRAWKVVRQQSYPQGAQPVATNAASNFPPPPPTTGASPAPAGAQVGSDGLPF